MQYTSDLYAMIYNQAPKQSYIISFLVGGESLWDTYMQYMIGFKQV